MEMVTKIVALNKNYGRYWVPRFGKCCPVQGSLVNIAFLMQEKEL